MRYPLVRTNEVVFNFLKSESAKLGIPMTELLELIIRTYQENPSLFSLATHGVIGEQEKWHVPVREYISPQRTLL